MKLVRRIVWIAAALAIAAGIGFWLRPISCFDDAIYLREAFSGVQSHSIRIHGYRVHYLVEGPASGRPVVLVHGLGGSAEDWRNLAPYLARAGFRVYIPDLPGYGRSQRPANFSYSVRDEASIVIGFMDALHLKQVDLGGWSMGGWIVQLVAAQIPERIQRLMIFDSAGLHVVPDWNTSLFTPSTPAELDQLDALLMPNPPKIPAYVARDILRNSRQNAWVVNRAMASMLTGRDTTDHLLPDLKMPVLIAWGAVDRITPIDQGEEMHRLIPQSQLDVFPNCGHLAALQCAGQMGPKVLTFLEQ